MGFLDSAVLVAVLAARAGATAAPASNDAAPVTHQRVEFRDHHFDVVTVDLRHADIKLFWKNEDGGAPIRGLRQLDNYLSAQGQELLFATNAGIYSKDFSPAGLHVEEGEEVKGLNMRDGGGNFHLKPNGVFYADAAGAHVVESTDYQDAAPGAFFATQSGPLLVQRGKLHPEFREQSTSTFIRSGVGVASPQKVVFALSREPVNFYTFASLFKDRLDCPDALYLDGQISRFYMPEVIEESGPAWYVGLLAVVAKPEAPARP